MTTFLLTIKKYSPNIFLLGILAFSFINIDKDITEEKKSMYKYEKTITHNSDLSWYLKADETPVSEAVPQRHTQARTVSQRRRTVSNVPDLDARYSNIRMYGESPFVLAFINKHKNYITTQSNAHNLNAPVIMAMLILENLDVANKRLNTCATQGHNYGNIKVKNETDRYLSSAFLRHVGSCSRRPHISHYDDDYNSRGQRVASQFYNWSSVECGLKAYILFLNSRVYMGHPNYADNFRDVPHTDHKRWAYAMYRSGYANISASDLAYDIKIMRIILQYDLVNKMK